MSIGRCIMAVTKYEAYYRQITEILETIKDNYQYSNLSLAFANWFLKTYFKLSDQEIEESIIDGANDNGIDAILIDDDKKELSVFQFKFPSENNIGHEIAQADILKTLNGFNILIDPKGTKLPQYNDKFIDYSMQLKDKPIYTFNIYFVSFNKGIIDNKNQTEAFQSDFCQRSGSKLEIFCYDKTVISNIYEKITRKNSLEIELKYKVMQSSYDIAKKSINSYTGVINGHELISAIKEKIVTIFDENIRLYEKKSEVNDSIKRTASGESSFMFYFYNNGIVFICDEAKHSPNAMSISLKGVSIVNGCQTVTSLFQLYTEGNLKKDVDLLVRIIEISDYSERMKITEFLNSQTPIRDSYFISNHTIIRSLQNDLLKKNVFLERQINEFDYKNMHNAIDKSIEFIVIPLEKSIQYYVGYWLNKYAYSAKSAKSSLFDKSKIDEILKDITADKLLAAYNMYNNISQVITKYRRTRRNEQKTEFADFLGISQNKLLSHINEYLFMNTGDILLLNATQNLKSKYKIIAVDCSDEAIIRQAIFIVKDIIKETTGIYSTLTKTSNVFQKMQDRIQTLDKQYECNNRS